MIYEAPLFFENGVHQWLRPVILVACDIETQRSRLATRDHLSAEQINNTSPRKCRSKKRWNSPITSSKIPAIWKLLRVRSKHYGMKLVDFTRSR